MNLKYEQFDDIHLTVYTVVVGNYPLKI